jgi:hypothetical protein
MTTLLYILTGMIIACFLVLARRRYAGFYGQMPEDYDESFPVFELRKHLDGEMICEGVIFGPLGRVTSSFIAEFDIKWDGDTGVMKERFRYNDGTTQDREWRITSGDGVRFSADADDVPSGSIGIISGSTVQMRYKIRMPESAGSHLLNTVDWMYLTPDGSIINRSQFRKFGFKVAELVATIRPKDMI